MATVYFIITTVVPFSSRAHFFAIAVENVIGSSTSDIPFTIYQTSGDEKKTKNEYNILHNLCLLIGDRDGCAFSEKQMKK